MILHTSGVFGIHFDSRGVKRSFNATGDDFHGLKSKNIGSHFVSPMSVDVSANRHFVTQFGGLENLY
jgi:hypothetical protein